MRYAAGVICTLLTLTGALHSRTAVAAVTAGDADYTYPIGQGGPVTISLNVTENFDINGSDLVSGSPRPLQLVGAFSPETTVQVMQNRNCLLITVPDPSMAINFTVNYTMADAGGPGGPAIAGGTITFTGSSTASYITPQNTACADVQFQPVASSDTASTISGQAVLIPVLANDLPQGTPNRRVIMGRDATNGDIFFVPTQGGDAQAQADNQIFYLPRPEFVGTDTFDYFIVDYQATGFETLIERGTVTVTVAPNPNPTGNEPDAQILVNGATNTTILDSDSQPGETVTFEVAPLDPAFPIVDVVRFDWFVGDETQPRQSGPSSSFTVALPDGSVGIKVVGIDTEGIEGMLSIVVNVGGAPSFAELPGLTPNQAHVATVLDRMCNDPAQNPDTSALSADQQDAFARCQAILSATPAEQMRALDELSAKDFNGAQTQTLIFTRSTYSGVSDRLGSLRSGARGVSAQGLSLIIDGKSIPLAEIERMVGKLLGGAASADEPGSLLGDRLGFWTRGNISLGSKGGSNADNGFDADQFSLAMGMDYRFTQNTVLGTALSFGSSNVAYNPTGEGGLDTKSWALALYGSGYATKNSYFDAVVNIARSTYDSHRRINYRDGVGLVDRNARGDTDGMTLSGGLSGGYDFVFGGLTLTPNGGVFYAKSGINGFRERGALGLDLIYDDQSFDSVTANAGLRASYAWSLPFGVLMPYFRGDFVRELQNHVEVFNVRFANDRDGSSIAVTATAPDQSYWRLSAGLSAQLRFGFSGYFEYQRLQGFELMKFADFAMGLRMQYRF